MEWDEISRLLSRRGYEWPADDPSGRFIFFGASKTPELDEPLRFLTLRADLNRALALVSLGPGSGSGAPFRSARRLPGIPADEAYGDLTDVVCVHFGFALAHGLMHVHASVPLGPGAIAFVIIVTQAGPFAGLAYMRRRPVAGALVIAATMAAALTFGLVNHFLVDGADNVDRVAYEPRAWFGLTALLLLLIEAIGVALGIRYGLRVLRKKSSSSI